MFTTHPGLWYRVRSGLKKGSFHNQLSMIEADVDRIRKMVATRPGTEQARSTVSTRIATTRRNKQDGKYFARVTEAARRFYASLNACWPVSCSQGTCAYVHTASLQIVDYTASSGADRLASRDQGQMNVDLKILFLLDEAGKPPEWNWKAVRVELEELERALGQPDNDCKLSEKEAPATWKFMRPKKPRVKFAEPQVLPPAHPSSSERIESLCQSLQKFNGTVSSTSVERAMRPCMGFLEEKGYLHYLYGTSIPACCKSKKKPITLGEAVNGGWRYPLKCLEKHTIAYLLASAVLQFHDTPWLRHNWTLNDVELIIDGSPSLARAQPIISKTFTQMGHLEDSNSGYRHTPSSIVKNPEMFSLALALLELYIGKPVMNTEEYGRTVAANGGVRNELTDYFAIKELLPVVEAREPENVYTAIYNCVEIHTMSKEYSLENDDFRQAFFDGVVLPLQSNYEVVRNIG
ncbi:hypothetical protein BJ508DRAFT_118589 [Ascobolus immersus RN42]|uniref:DUF7580 domain-containing protein n=1 Tax=Ascobolus immersus RN42 TaxID=1160509 RepID=A0A3N4IA22_ASCIM|nr:hypothetical protein BJ508DRAFT_118589 [Ascobolus immersus RN42]